MKKCEVCGDKGYYNKKSDKILCPKHYMQFKRHNIFIEQTRFARNKHEINGDTCKVYFNDKQGNIYGHFIIDTEDYEKIKDYKWFSKEKGVGHVLSSNIYNISKSTHVRVHNIIMGIDVTHKGEYVIDHIDNNPLNNRKCNLRRTSDSQNGMNKRIQSNNSTGVVGVVSKSSDNTSPWIPQIKKDGKMIRLGTRYTFDEAVKVRLKAEATMFNEHSFNYNIETKTIQLTYLSHDDKLETFIEVDMNGNVKQFLKVSQMNTIKI